MSDFDITLTRLAELLGISRVTLNNNKNKYAENKDCINKKCKLLFMILENEKFHDKGKVLRTIHLVKQYIEGMEKVSSTLLKDNNLSLAKINLYANGIVMLSLIGKKNNKITEEDNWIIDRSIRDIGHRFNRSYSSKVGKKFVRLSGKTYTIQEADLDKLQKTVNRYKFEKKENAKPVKTIQSEKKVGKKRFYEVGTNVEGVISEISDHGVVVTFEYDKGFIHNRDIEKCAKDIVVFVSQKVIGKVKTSGRGRILLSNVVFFDSDGIIIP